MINAKLFDQTDKVFYYQPLSYHNNNVQDENELDPDMYFCSLLRNNGVFMFVTNMDKFGHLALMDSMDITLKNPEFYEIYSNEIEWRKRYIHENYSQNLLDSTVIAQPCPDVYWFPVVTPTFCRHLIGNNINPFILQFNILYSFFYNKI